MKEFFYERIGEEVCRERLANGLEVCVVPKPGYAKKYAFFSTRYGGMDTRTSRPLASRSRQTSSPIRS